jgi:hypothetical protein
MAKKITKKFTATLVLNTEQGGAWLANVSLLTPLQGTNNLNSIPDAEAVSFESAWKNASAGKRWIKAKVLELTPRKSVKMEATKVDKTTDKPTAFGGVLEFKA